MSLTVAHAACSSLATCALLRKIDLRGDIFVLVTLAVTVGLAVLQRTSGGVSILAAVANSALLVTIHFLCVVVVVVLYRISPLHPLYAFPGPLLNRITSFKHLHMVATGKRHHLLAELHAKYGTFLRLTPDCISINSLDAVGPIYMAANAYDRSTTYTLGRLPGGALMFIRERVPHNERRKVWAAAFTPSALKENEHLLHERTNQLVACINARKDSQGIVDIMTCFRHWAYDLMGDLTFGGSNEIELMRDGDPDGLIEAAQAGIATFEIFTQVPPLFDILSVLPTSESLHKLDRLCETFIANRKKLKPEEKKLDMMSHFLAENPGASHSPLSGTTLLSETAFAVDAGADTTPGVSTLLFFHLLQNSSAYERLTRELDEAFPSGEMRAEDIGQLAKLPYLSAVVNEGLRLGSPFSSVPRVVPKGGLVVKDQYIPEGYVASVPIWPQHISTENFFPAPLEFIPERWLPGGLGPDSVCRANALMAFSFGVHGCIGRPLAMRQLNALVATMLLAFDLKLAPDFDPKAFWDGVDNFRSTQMRLPLSVQAVSRQR